ncbi:MAG: hypothetical protein Q8Q02_01280, partial [Nocardioides sp.]|nr:hypothetical protein [Nocardioides sp.]
AAASPGYRGEMSEETPSVDEHEWPTTCDLCGTELQSAVTGFAPGDTEGTTRGGSGEVLAVDFCPNRDCPGRVPDPEPTPGARPQPAREDLPGSMGGDHGGG